MKIPLQCVQTTDEEVVEEVVQEVVQDFYEDYQEYLESKKECQDIDYSWEEYLDDIGEGDEVYFFG